MSGKQPAIDLKHLQQYTGGDVQMEREIYSLFREQVRVWLKLLIVDGDAEGWAAAAHSLKGSARGIGAHQLAAACEAAEAVIRAGTPARSVAAAQIREQVDAVMQFIDKREYKLQIQDLRI